jgi:hypothetical protein
MGWIEEHFHKLTSDAPVTPGEAKFETREQDVWAELCRGFERDVNDFKQHGGSASFSNRGDSCGVTSSDSHTTAVLSADPEAHVIRYDYQPEGARIGVPEGGIFSLRSGERGVEIYSADQRLTPEEARRLVLEPLFFPAAPEEDKSEDTAP